MSSTVPRVSISCPTTYTASIFEDIKNYSEAGATGIGLWEYKLDGHDDGEIKAAMDSAGLSATSVAKFMYLWDTRNDAA
ncbi:MAG TPA: hypothetical protein VHY31_17705 [Streptosporangiaceae bacterium]|nr:hypothetical protein [Streptosporangiaceae bacterium]